MRHLAIPLITVAMCDVCHHIYGFINLKIDHTPDLDNFLSIANSVMNLFWPPDPSNPPPADRYLQSLVAKYDIKKDFGAFCYAFCIRLVAASGGAIRERQEELIETTSSLLRILEDPDIVATVTGPNKQSYYYYAFVTLHRCEALAEGLLSRVEELYSSS